MKRQKYLLNPYPFYYQNKLQLVTILLSISLISWFFNYFFEPFEVNYAEHKMDFLWICFLHAFLPFFISLAFFLLLSKYVKKDYTWTLLKELISISFLLLLISLGSFLIRDIIYDNPNNWSFRYLFEEFRNTFLIGFLIILLILPINFERLLNKYKSKAKQITFRNLQKTPSNTVTIHNQAGDQLFSFNVTDFVYAKVESNYTEIYISTAASLQKKLVRISLKQLASLLDSYSYIFQSHRSFIVNTNYIKAVSGNAQGYSLEMTITDLYIPVSRTRIQAFDDLYAI